MITKDEILDLKQILPSSNKKYMQYSEGDYTCRYWGLHVAVSDGCCMTFAASVLYFSLVIVHVK